MNPADIKDIFRVMASQIDDGHWQSGFPLPFDQVPKAGVDVVVLCATDAQPGPQEIANLRRVYPDLGGILCPFEDTESQRSLPNIIRIANKAADAAMARIQAGKNILVTCAAGRNRSGLVSALVLMRRRNLSGQEAVAWVREKRNAAFGDEPMALSNQMFSRYLSSLPRPGG